MTELSPESSPSQHWLLVRLKSEAMAEVELWKRGERVTWFQLGKKKTSHWQGPWPAGKMVVIAGQGHNIEKILHFNGMVTILPNHSNSHIAEVAYPLHPQPRRPRDNAS